MRKLVKVMVDYKMYHTHPWNIYTHFVGVPLVTFSLFLLLAWFRFVVPDYQISVAMIFFLGTMIHYLRLNLKIAFYVLISFGPLLLLAEYCARLSFATSFQIFLLTFVLGWIFQLTGHYIEGKRPALIDNFSQIFNAPIFLVCEFCFMTGRLPEVKTRIDYEYKMRQEMPVAR